MQCFIYRGSRKDGLYLYLAKADDFSCIPDALKKQAGQLELAMELELNADTSLNREDPAVVIASLQTQGYHVQMPQTIESLINTLNRQEK